MTPHYIPRPSDSVKSSPMYTLREFGTRKGVEPKTMEAFFSHCPDGLKPIACNVVPTNRLRYALVELERWWRNRPITIDEGAKRFGATYYSLKLAVVASGIPPVAQVQRRSDLGPDVYYRAEDMQRAWSNATRAKEQG